MASVVSVRWVAAAGWADQCAEAWWRGPCSGRGHGENCQCVLAALAPRGCQTLAADACVFSACERKSLPRSKSLAEDCAVLCCAVAGGCDGFYHGSLAGSWHGPHGCSALQVCAVLWLSPGNTPSLPWCLQGQGACSKLPHHRAQGLVSCWQGSVDTLQW
jgi:hypothetical protein